MLGIEFLTLPDLLQIHFNQIEKYGGSPATRDDRLLSMLLQNPRSSIAGKYTYRFPFEMAAEYLFEIATQRPFVEGNCRTALLAALTFLEWNEFHIEADPGKLAQLALSIASGKASKEELVQFFEKHVVHPVDSESSSS